MVSQEIIFKGSPYDFVEFAKDVAKRLARETGIKYGARGISPRNFTAKTYVEQLIKAQARPDDNPLYVDIEISLGRFREPGDKRIRFGALRLSDNRSKVELPVVNEQSPLFAYFQFLVSELKRLGQLEKENSTLESQTSNLQNRPKKPPKDAKLFHWFDYYHACKKGKIKYTLADVAEDASLTRTYVRQEHMRYKSERGID